VVALERTELVKFSKREITWLAERHSQLRHLLGEVVEHRIHDSIEQIQTEGFV
jgi:hypothetical protein